MAPKKFTYTPGTGGGKQTKAFAKKGAASKAASAKDKAALDAWAKSQQARGAFGPVTGMGAPRSTSAQFNLNSAGMGKKSPLNKQVKGTVNTLNEITGVAPAQRIAQGKGSKMDVAMTAMSVLPVGKIAGLAAKGGKAAASGLKAANAVASTAKTGPAAAGINVGKAGKYISVAKKPADVFTTPKPTKAMYTKDGVFDEAGFKAATTKFKKAKTAWENNARETQQFKQARGGADTSARPASATTAQPAAEVLTPRQIAREKAALARRQAAGGDIAKSGREKGTAERRFQDKQRGQERPLGERTRELMRAPEGSNPRPVQNMTPPERVAARPSRGTRPPRRDSYKTQAGYDRALARWEAKSTAALPERAANVAETITPPAPTRRGGFKNTGSKRIEEADISEGTIKRTGKFQGIRPGRAIPEYRKVIDNVDTPAPAAKGRGGKASKPAAPSKPAENVAAEAKAPAATKPASKPKESSASKPAEVEKPVRRPAAMKPSTKEGASKSKFGGGMKASARPKPADKNVIRGEVVPSTKGPQAGPKAGQEVAVRNSAVSKPEYGSFRLRPQGRAGAPRAISESAAKPAAAAAKPKMSKLKKALITTGATAATGVALKLTRDTDVSPNDAKAAGASAAAGTPTAGFGTVKFGARNPKPGVYLDKYGRSIDKAEFNRRKVWWNEAKKMSKAEFDKAYAAEVARRKGYRSGEGAAKFGKAATEASANKGVPVGVSEKKWATLTSAQKAKVRKAAKANPSGSAFQWVKSATK